jgi:hypothetical protein
MNYNFLSDHSADTASFNIAQPAIMLEFCTRRLGLIIASWQSDTESFQDPGQGPYFV